MDYYLFLSLIFLGVLYIYRPLKITFFLYILAALLFIIIIRLDPKGVDFQEYYRYLHHVDGIRYYREFIYFSMGLIFFDLIKSEIISFILMDLIWIYALYRACKIVDLKNDISLFVILFTSFPLFFGYENIYRQLFAEVFILLAYVYIDKFPKKAFLYFIISIFMHNIALLIFPLFILKRFFKLNTGGRILLATILVAIIGSLLSTLSQFKSGHDTGLSLEYAYLLVYIFIFILGLALYKYRIVKFVEMFPSIYFGLLMLALMVLILPVGMIAERMGMFFLLITLVDLYKISFFLKPAQRGMYKILLHLFVSLPVLIFPSATSLLIGS